MNKILIALLALTSLSYSEIIYLTKERSVEAELRTELHNEHTATLELTIPAIGKFPRTVDGTVYDFIQVKNLPSILEEGKPFLPIYKTNFVAPEGAEFSYTVVESEYVTLENVNAHPALRSNELYSAADRETWEMISKYDIPPEFVKNRNIYSSNSYYPGPLAEVHDVTEFRNTNLAEVRMHPVQYNPVLKILKVYTKLKIRMEFTGGNYKPYALKNQSAKIVARNAVNGRAFVRSRGTRPNDDKYDVLIITTPEYIKPVEALAKWQSQKGYDVKIESKSSWTVSAVKSTTKSFWEANDNPEYFLVVGEFEDIPGDSTDYRTWTDLPYVMFDDGNDYFAEMANGRISVHTEEQAWTVVNKILKYEQDPPADDAYYKHVLNLAQFQDNKLTDTADLRFSETAEEIQKYLSTEGYSPVEIYDVDKDEINPMYHAAGQYGFANPVSDHLKRPNYSWKYDERDIAPEWNKGPLMVFHNDHGLIEGFAWPRFRNIHVDTLKNGDKLPIVFSMACLTGRFKTDTCFAEKLLRKENGGAVGIVAACRESYSGYTDALVHGIIDAIWADPGFPMKSPKVPDPVVESHEPIYTMGDAVLFGLLQQKAWWGIIHDAFLIFHYHGDPTMSIWTAKPKALSAKYANLIHPTAKNFAVKEMNISDGYATLYSKGIDKIVGKMKVSGSDVTIPVSSQLTLHDTLTLTVTSHNYRPLIKDIPVSNDQTAIGSSNSNKYQKVNIFINNRKFAINGDGEVKIRLYSVSGRKVYEKHWKTINKNMKITVPGLSTGLYMVKLQSGKREMVENMFYVKR